ncbi:NAD(P)/FAD-dependent oxidoreductase [Streptomyces sp. L7]
MDRLLALGGRPGHNMIAGTWGLPGLGGRRPEDDRYETVAVRRPVLEAALLAEAEQTPGVTVRRGVRVTGLLTGDARTTGSPQVTGVLTQDGESPTADLVVDAGGRNSPVAELLARIGAAPDEQRAETGFRYCTRFFRSADGTARVPTPSP